MPPCPVSTNFIKPSKCTVRKPRPSQGAIVAAEGGSNFVQEFGCCQTDHAQVDGITPMFRQAAD